MNKEKSGGVAHHMQTGCGTDIQDWTRVNVSISESTHCDMQTPFGRTSFSKTAFSSAAPSSWNCLPASVLYSDSNDI